jgi:hypothetical protein
MNRWLRVSLSVLAAGVFFGAGPAAQSNVEADRARIVFRSPQGPPGRRPDSADRQRFGDYIRRCERRDAHLRNMKRIAGLLPKWAHPLGDWTG